MVTRLEGRDAIQRHLDMLEWWNLGNIMAFNKAEFKRLSSEMQDG